MFRMQARKPKAALELGKTPQRSFCVLHAGSDSGFCQGKVRGIGRGNGKAGLGGGEIKNCRADCGADKGDLSACLADAPKLFPSPPECIEEYFLPLVLALPC